MAGYQCLVMDTPSGIRVLYGFGSTDKKISCSFRGLRFPELTMVGVNRMLGLQSRMCPLIRDRYSGILVMFQLWPAYKSLIEGRWLASDLERLSIWCIVFLTSSLLEFNVVTIGPNYLWLNPSQIKE